MEVSKIKKGEAVTFELIVDSVLKKNLLMFLHIMTIYSVFNEKKEKTIFVYI